MSTKWTPAHDAVLRTHYIKLGAGGILRAGMLPGDFTRFAIKQRAKKIGAARRPVDIPPVPHERWWDYPVALLGVAPRAVLA